MGQPRAPPSAPAPRVTGDSRPSPAARREIDAWPTLPDPFPCRVWPGWPRQAGLPSQDDGFPKTNACGTGARPDTGTSTGDRKSERLAQAESSWTCCRLPKACFIVQLRESGSVRRMADGRSEDGWMPSAYLSYAGRQAIFIPPAGGHFLHPVTMHDHGKRCSTDSTFSHDARPSRYRQ